MLEAGGGGEALPGCFTLHFVVSEEREEVWEGWKGRGRHYSAGLALLLSSQGLPRDQLPPHPLPHAA